MRRGSLFSEFCSTQQQQQQQRVVDNLHNTTVIRTRRIYSFGWYTTLRRGKKDRLTPTRNINNDNNNYCNVVQHNCSLLLVYCFSRPDRRREAKYDVF